MPVIFISGAEATQEAFVDQSVNFASRPQPPSWAFYSNSHRTIATAAYGPLWRSMRRNLSHALSPGKIVSSYKHIRKSEIEELLTRLRQEAACNHCIVEPRVSVNLTVFRIMVGIAFGWNPTVQNKETSFLNEELYNALADIIEVALIGSLGDYIPFLRPVLHYQDNRRRALTAYVEKGLLPMVADRRRLLGAAKKEQEALGMKVDSASCYLDLLLSLDEEDVASDRDIVWRCVEVILAGTDSTAVTLEWGLLNLVLYPEIQKKVRDELDAVVGDRLVDEDDIDNLPYLKGFVKETLRRHPPGQFSSPHVATEACKVAGFDIPAGAYVHFQQAVVSNDPDVWEQPSEFRPERFSDAAVDVSEGVKLMMVPFGCGRRICPGMHLANLHLHMILARLVQTFEWKVSALGADIDLTSKLEHTLIKLKVPLKASISERIRN